MLIDLSKPRKKYFQRWTPRNVLLQYMQKPRFLPEHLRELGNVVVGTREGSLDDLLGGKAYQADNLGLVKKVKQLERGSLLVLPEHYRIPAGESRRLVAYRFNSLVHLNRFMKPGRGAEEVYEAAFGHLHKHRNSLIDRTGLGCYWISEMDKLMRVVMLINNIEGQELRAFQNLAWYKLDLPEFRNEAEREGDERKLNRCIKYDHHLSSRRREGRTLQHYVNQLQVRRRDIIEAISPDRSLVMNFRAPSRSDIYREYDLKVCNVPIVGSSSPRRTTDLWDIYGECYCKDKNYRSDRRSKSKEFYFCPHEIASLQGLKAMHELEGRSERVHSLPFIIPTRSLVDFVDKLRYRTVILEKNPESGKLRMHSLNDTELGALAMKKMIADPFHENATTDYNVFRKQKYDPLLDLVKFA